MSRNGRFWSLACALGVTLVVPSVLHAQGSSAGGFDASAERAFSPNAFGDSAADLVFTPVAPCRILDTRSSVAGIMIGGTQRNFLVTGTTNFPDQGGTAGGCGIPAGRATAVVINFAAVTPTGAGNLRAWAVASPQPAAPGAAVMNYSTALAALANGVVVPICNPAVTSCAAGHMRLQADVSSVHVVGDVLGYFGRTGQTMSGVISARYVPHTPNPFFLLGASYPVPYPAGATLPTLEYVPGAGTATCPGDGQAAAGRLCIYAINVSNFSNVNFSGSGNTRYGFSVDAFPTTSTSPAWLIANWTVTIP